ncbi:hypothetical protein NDU88_003335 [Pleurodeles waltl]|uniref:Uncharacterized protein n=1 Tax=Pleurodeles waltl TaxID=8319 RepID=A0AAV7WS35_PLEWA|nr:hypothetical protein NDU88_003335 [Pleurodeles waltl]
MAGIYLCSVSSNVMGPTIPCTGRHPFVGHHTEQVSLSNRSFAWAFQESTGLFFQRFPTRGRSQRNARSGIVCSPGSAVITCIALTAASVATPKIRGPRGRLARSIFRPTLPSAGGLQLKGLPHPDHLWSCRTQEFSGPPAPRCLWLQQRVVRRCTTAPPPAPSSTPARRPMLCLQPLLSSVAQAAVRSTSPSTRGSQLQGLHHYSPLL